MTYLDALFFLILMLAVSLCIRLAEEQERNRR